jgi:hypothetical protein
LRLRDQARANPFPNSSHGGGVIKKMVDDKFTPDQIIENLYIRSLCRPPNAEEKVAMRSLVGDAVKDTSAYEDIFWSLLNCSEFAFNH